MIFEKQRREKNKPCAGTGTQTQQKKLDTGRWVLSGDEDRWQTNTESRGRNTRGRTNTSASRYNHYYYDHDDDLLLLVSLQI